MVIVIVTIIIIIIIIIIVVVVVIIMIIIIIMFVLQPKALSQELHDSLVKEKLSTLESAKAFVKMLRSFRGSGKTSIAETLTSPDSFYLVWVPQIVNLLLLNELSFFSLYM
jgi:hypothetical protein